MNTGPIHVESVPVGNPTAAWSDLLTAGTEEIILYREIADGRVLVPHLDPRGGGGGYAERSINGTWTDEPDAISSSGPEHVFDIVEHQGSLWACGSAHTIPPSGDPSQAVVWRSTDGGATWTESLRDPDPSNYARFYFMAAVGPVLSVRNAEPGTTYSWTAADGWTIVGDILPPADGSPGSAWAGGWLIPSEIPGTTASFDLYLFTGSTSTVIASGVTGWSIGDDGNLYVITSGRSIRRAAPTAPNDFATLAQISGQGYTSLAVLPGSAQALIGTTASLARLVDLPAT